MEQMPFYMTFPMQNLYVMELEYEKDMERMKSLYPTEVAKIQAMIEERCDELEYEGGRIFDEEPDRYMMQEEVMKLYDRIAQGDMAEMEVPAGYNDRKIYFPDYTENGMFAQDFPRRERRHDRRECDNWLCSMVGIMFTNEIYRRRCRHRRCNIWW